MLRFAVVCVLAGSARSAPAALCGRPLPLRQAGCAPCHCGIPAAQPVARPGERLALRGGGDDAEAQEAQGYDEIPVQVLTDMGREAIGEKKYGEAADYFSAALARNVDQHGELAAECAELYYLYGSALALEAEETDDNLFGPSVPAQLPVEQVPACCASLSWMRVLALAPSAALMFPRPGCLISPAPSSTLPTLRRPVTRMKAIRLRATNPRATRRRVTRRRVTRRRPTRPTVTSKARTGRMSTPARSSRALTRPLRKLLPMTQVTRSSELRRPASSKPWQAGILLHLHLLLTPQRRPRMCHRMIPASAPGRCASLAAVLLCLLAFLHFLACLGFSLSLSLCMCAYVSRCGHVCFCWACERVLVCEDVDDRM